MSFFYLAFCLMCMVFFSLILTYYIPFVIIWIHGVGGEFLWFGCLSHLYYINFPSLSLLIHTYTAFGANLNTNEIERKFLMFVSLSHVYGGIFDLLQFCDDLDSMK